MTEMEDFVDKKLILEYEIRREIDLFKERIDNLKDAFEKDTNVYLKKLVPALYFDSITVEIDFEKTREMRKK